jgi:hypothetical protein
LLFCAGLRERDAKRDKHTVAVFDQLAGTAIGAWINLPYAAGRRQRKKSSYKRRAGALVPDPCTQGKVQADQRVMALFGGAENGGIVGRRMTLPTPPG